MQLQSEDNVKLHGNQTIEGVKTFDSPPIIPSSSDPDSAATRGYVDSVIPSFAGGTAILNFGTEQDWTSNTILSAAVTNANFRGITFIPTGTSETSLDDFTLNGVTFNIENIVDGVSFDIRGSAVNNASGNYTVNYIITII